MIGHIPELMESGIDSFKIEGRMKSAYYAAVVTNTYRMAMDRYTAGNYVFDEAWQRELESVSHREYATGYYFSDSREDANLTTQNGYMKEKAYLAVVLKYDSTTGLALMSQRNKMKLGDKIEVITPGSVGKPLEYGELYGEDMQPIEATSHPYMSFYMKTAVALREGDIIRAAE
jgi:putative protease